MGCSLVVGQSDKLGFCGCAPVVCLSAHTRVSGNNRSALVRVSDLGVGLAGPVVIDRVPGTALADDLGAGSSHNRFHHRRHVAGAAGAVRSGAENCCAREFAPLAYAWQCDVFAAMVMCRRYFLGTGETGHRSFRSCKNFFTSGSRWGRETARHPCAVRRAGPRSACAVERLAALRSGCVF